MATRVRAQAVGPITDELGTRIVSQTPSTITIGWDHVAGQEGFIPTIDGSETLTDGKRHPNTSQTQTQVRVSKKQDGKQHDYGVIVVGRIAGGSVRA